MKDEIAISVKNVSKAYRIWQTPADRLFSTIWQGLGSACPDGSALQKNLRSKARASYRDFYALRDVSLEVRKGECLGIVGRNGSGKSTLLQLLAGTLQPTTGEIKVKGRIAALLELGSGFNPDFTGRENVFLNAAILGLTREQIEARFDHIARFAEIGEFIDEPVKIYSSGMAVRLAFAVIAHVDADIMIIDEALAVGDARFQLKCARAIDRFVEQGVTLLFVSHAMSMVKRLCGRASLLEQGQMIYTGKPNTIVNLYSKLLADGGSAEALKRDVETLNRNPDVEFSIGAKSRAPLEDEPIAANRKAPTAFNDRKDAQLIADERAHVQVSGHEYSYGGELGKLEEPVMQGENGECKTCFESGEKVIVTATAVANEALTEPIYALTIKNHRGEEIYGTNTYYASQPAPAIQPGERHRVHFRFAMNLIAGTYFISLGWTQFVGEELVVIHRRYDVVKFEVLATDRSFGVANLWARINVDPDL